MIRADGWCTILTAGQYCSVDRQDTLSWCHRFFYNCRIYSQGNEPRNWGFWFHNQCFAKCYLATLLRGVCNINDSCRAECGVLSEWKYPEKIWVLGKIRYILASQISCRLHRPCAVRRRLSLPTAWSSTPPPVSPETLLLYATKVHQKSIAVEVIGFSIPFFVSNSHASSERLGATGLRLHEKNWHVCSSRLSKGLCHR